MSEQSESLKRRASVLSVRLIRFIDTMPHRPTADVLARQVVRSATSVAANYRAACRARSRAEFAAKLHIVQEEADETVYWLKLIGHTSSLTEELNWLRKEATELTAIFTAACATARRNLKRD